MTLHTRPTRKPLRPGYFRPLGLVLLIVGPCLLYSVYAARYTVRTRIEAALSHNEEVAQLTARLLDEQWDMGVSILRALDTRRLLVMLVTSHNRIDPGRARQFLHETVALDPDLLLAAVYTPDGRLIAAYPPKPKAPEDATSLDWYRNLSHANGSYFGGVSSIDTSELSRNRKLMSSSGPTEAIAFAVPVEAHGTRHGYLIVYYRISEIDAWLQQIRITDGSTIFLADVTGRVLTASGGVENRSVNLKHYLPLERALRGVPGAVTTHALRGPDSAIVGYAYAAKPGWPVLVVQPRARALAATNSLLIWLSILLAPMLLSMVGGAIALARMVHGTQDMAARLQAQNDRLRAADQAKSEFLANVSHDLRTPLSGLRLSVSGLIDPAVEMSPEQVRECLHLASQELDQLTARVRNLLEMSRIEARAFEPNTELTDLTDVVASALERLTPLTRGRKVSAEFPPEPMLVECDHAQIETVLVNLIENALKYSPASAPIELRGVVNPGWVGCAVRDYGRGLGSGDPDLLFEKFYRAPEVRSVGGTGLGLAICKAIIEAHHGHIEARAMGDGAEFTFYLPAATVADGGSHD